ncbi:MAG TPA: hypothetical protein VEZ89_00880 [Rubrivivax sp.]|nr:hypothetical protein [Rubrivivax sp.]
MQYLSTEPNFPSSITPCVVLGDSRYRGHRVNFQSTDAAYRAQVKDVADADERFPAKKFEFVPWIRTLAVHGAAS